MIRFNLFTKTFLLILLIVVFFSALIYTFSVPLIKETVYEIEENAGKTILDNVYELVHKISMDLEAYRKSAYTAHKRELKNIIEIVDSYINNVLDIAKIEAGRVEWKDEDVDIAEVFRRAAVTTSSLLQSKGLYLEGGFHQGFNDKIKNTLYRERK